MNKEFLENCFNVRISKDIIEDLMQANHLIWVWSWLSSSPAEFGRKTINEVWIPWIFQSPYEFVESNINRWMPVLISYRWKNLDIQSVADKIVKSWVKKILLISWYIDTRVSKFLEKNWVKVHIISLPEHIEEKSFVSVKATTWLITLILKLRMKIKWENKSIDFKKISDKAEIMSKNLSNKIILQDWWRKNKWIILSCWIVNYSTLCWQSSLMEAWLVSPIIWDIKDYSHWKYLSAFEERNINYLIIDSYQSNSDIVNKLFSRLCIYFNIYVIKPDFDSISWYLENIFIAFKTVDKLSKSQNLSIKNPPKPKEMWKWKNWWKLKSINN